MVFKIYKVCVKSISNFLFILLDCSALPPQALICYNVYSTIPILLQQFIFLSNCKQNYGCRVKYMGGFYTGYYQCKNMLILKVNILFNLGGM